MGSSTKKKKRRKADFQKVKLKAGRRLPKGNNITDASFKTKKIQIPNKVKPTNEVKLRHSLQEIFSLLQHHNTSAREAALLELKEVLIQNPETIRNSLGRLIENICQVITDKSPEARKTTIILLRLIFKRVSCAQIIPFFPILSAYLCCAMTHITPEIQVDSLEFFDLLIEEFPEPLITSSNNILSNFLEQISYKQTLKCSSLNQRTIITNPELKVFGPSWRVSVLHRLEKVLQAFLKFSPGKSTAGDSWISLTWDKKPLNFHPSINPQENLVEPDKTLRDKQQTTLEMMRDSKYLQEFIKTVIPLLSETWIELNPSRDVSTFSEAVVSSHPLDNLLVLMKIYRLFLSCLQLLKQEDYTQEPMMMWFQRNFEEDFINQFMKHFPYNPSFHMSKKKKPATTKGSIEETCCNLNLAICDIFTSISREVTTANSVKWNLILEYINSALTFLKQKGSVTNLELLINVLKKVLGKIEFQDKTEDFLRVVIDLFKDSNTDSEFYNLLLNFLSELVLNPSFKHLEKSTSLTLWLTILPKNVVKGGKLSCKVAFIAHQLVSYNKEAFRHCLASEIPNIIDFMANLGNSNEENENLKILIKILFWAPFLHKMDFCNLAKIVNNKRKTSAGIEDAVLIIRVINQRYRKCFINSEAPHYVSFIITIVLGFFWSELNSIKQPEDSSKLPIGITVVKNGNHKLEMDFRIIQEAVNGIKQLKCNVDKLKIIIFSSLANLLDSCHILPFSSAISLLRFIYNFWQPNRYINFTFAVKLAKLTVATLHVHLNKVSLDNDHSFQDFWFPVEYYAHLTSDILDVILKLSKDISEEAQAVNCISILSHLLQSNILDSSDFNIFEKIMKILQVRFGEELEKNIAWCSLQYDFSLRKTTGNSVLST